MNMWRVGEDMGSKERVDVRGVMMRENRQEVARSALVKGIESKMAALIWRAAPGYLRWNCAIFGFAWTCV
jgi:hypothetical protein